MELAALATRIDRRWQIGEQLTVEGAADEVGRELRRVDADESRGNTERAATLGQRGCRLAPEREERCEAGAGEQSLAVCTNVGEKKIAKRNP